jgi:hypothetical protein
MIWPVMLLKSPVPTAWAASIRAARAPPLRRKLIELTTDPVTGVSQLRIWRFVSEPWIGKKAQAKFLRELEALRVPYTPRETAEPIDESYDVAYMRRHPKIWPGPKVKRARRTK